jgi:hypothetical protein
MTPKPDPKPSAAPSKGSDNQTSKPEKQVVIDRSKLITEIAGNKPNEKSTPEQIAEYRKMLEAITDTSSSTDDLKLDMQYQLRIWLAEQMQIPEDDPKIETVIQSFSSNIDLLIQALSTPEDTQPDKFEEVFNQVSLRLDQYMYQTRIKEIFEPGELAEQQQQEAIKATLSEPQTQKVLTKVLKYTLSEKDYALVMDLISAFLQGSMSLSEFKSAVDSKLKDSPEAKILGITECDTLLEIAPDISAQSMSDDSLTSQLAQLSGLDMLDSTANLPAVFRLGRIFEDAAKVIGVDKKILLKLKNESFLELKDRLNDNTFMNSFKNETQIQLKKIQNYLNDSSRIQNFINDFVATANSSELEPDIREELAYLANNPKNFTLDMLIMSEFDTQVTSSQSDLWGQRLIQSVRAYRAFVKHSDRFRIKGQYNPGLEIAREHIHKNPLIGTTQTALVDTNTRVKKLLSGEALETLSEADFHKKLAQYNTYIEDFNRYARNQERTLLQNLAKAQASGDKLGISSAQEALSQHRISHASAIESFGQYSRRFNAKMQSLQGTMMGETLAELQTKQAQSAKAGVETGSKAQHLSDKVDDVAKSSADDLMREMKYGKAIRGAKYLGIATVATLPHLWASKDGDSSAKKIAISIGETAGMFVPVVGTILTLRQALYGETLAGDKIEGWDRLLTLGFGILQAVSDVLVLAGGVGVGMRAALVGAKMGSGAAKTVLATQKAPILGRMAAKLSYGFSKGGRAKYIDDLVARGKDLEQLGKMGYGEAFLKSFSVPSTFAGNMGRLTGKLLEERKYVKTLLSGAATVLATPLTIGNLVPRLVYGIGGVLGRASVGIRSTWNSAKIWTVAKTLGASKDEVLAATKLYKDYQKANLLLITANRSRGLVIEQIFALAKQSGFNGTDLIEVLKYLKTTKSKKASELFKQLSQCDKSLDLHKYAVRQAAFASADTALPKANKLFAEMAQIGSTTKLEARLEKLVNSSELGLSTIRLAEKGLLGAMGASIAAPILFGTDVTTVPSVIGTSVATGAELGWEGVKYTVAGGRGAKRESWYKRTDSLALKISEKRRWVSQYLEMSAQDLALLYFNQSGLTAGQREALLLVIDQRGYSISDLSKAYYKQK